MKKYDYFKQGPNEPKPLEKSVLHTVRFNEIDLMQVVWHGHYVAMCEDARMALGDAVGLGYEDFFKRGIFLPVRQMHLDYLAPLVYGHTYEVKARLFYSEAVRLNVDFTILDECKKIMTRGYSVQLLVDKNQQFLFERPAFYQEICQLWKEGKLRLP